MTPRTSSFPCRSPHDVDVTPDGVRSIASECASEAWVAVNDALIRVVIFWRGQDVVDRRIVRKRGRQTASTPRFDIESVNKSGPTLCSFQHCTGLHPARRIHVLPPANVGERADSAPPFVPCSIGSRKDTSLGRIAAKNALFWTLRQLAQASNLLCVQPRATRQMGTRFDSESSVWMPKPEQARSVAKVEHFA